MTRKKELIYESSKPGISFNKILSDEKYGWKKNNCSKRNCDEWLADRKAFPDNKRPSTDKDSGWERKIFDFFEPFYLTGCIDNMGGGDTKTTMGKHGSQLDIIFFLKAFDKELKEIKEYVVFGEAKNSINIDNAYENAISQLYAREFELRKIYGNDVIYQPIVCLTGDRKAYKLPYDARFQEIQERVKVVWENDIEYYINQSQTLGWNKTWRLFLYDVLNIKSGKEDKLIIPAIKFLIKGKMAYSAFIPAEIALNICHVERARKHPPHGVYQRPLINSRLKEISEDLKNYKSLNTCFPNSIVASFDCLMLNKLNSTIWNEVESDTSSISKLGYLELPNIYGLIKIIDGQHRVYAHDLISIDQISNYGLPFTILEDLKPSEEMTLFKSINTNAEEVNPNLVDIILYTMSDIETDRGLASSIICSLEFKNDDWTELFDHLGTGIKDYDNGKYGTKIKIDNLVQPIIRGKEEYDLIRDNNKGWLNPITIPDKLEYGKDVFFTYFASLKTISSRTSFWVGYVRTRAGLRLMLMFLSTWIRTKKICGNPVDKLKLEELAEKIFDNRKIIIKYFDDTKGGSRGDEDLKDIVNKIL